jgi:hypothetical protein
MDKQAGREFIKMAGLSAAWVKGYRLGHDAPKQVIEGRLMPCPQCQ